MVVVVYVPASAIDNNTTPTVIETVISYPNTNISFFDDTEASTGWLWDFGDNITSDEQNATHAYTNVGNYVVNLTTTIDNIDDTESVYYVAVDNAPVINSIVPSDYNPAVGGIVSFVPSINTENCYCLWNFGDGSVGYAKDETHLYDSTSTRTVTLTVTSPWGEDTKSITITPVSKALPESDCIEYINGVLVSDISSTPTATPTATPTITTTTTTSDDTEDGGIIDGILGLFGF